MRTLSKLCAAVALDPRARVENSLRASAFGPGDLLPRVKVVPSGTLEIARLQREGYAYIRP